MPEDPISDTLKDLKAQAAWLEEELSDLVRRIEAVESGTADEASEIEDVPPAVPVAESVDIPPTTASAPSEPSTPTDSEPPPIPRETRHEAFRQIIDRSAKPATESTSSIQWEQLIGQNLLNRVGAVVLLLSAVFFVKYAFDQGWLSPAARVGIGGLAGAALIIVGEVYLKKSMRVFAGGLLGCGIGICYVAAFGAYNFYGLISPPAAMILYTAVTVVTIVVSVHARMQPVAMLAVLGGFGTPIALRSEIDQQVALMTYILLLNTGLLVCAHLRRWDVILGLSWVGTVGLFAGWWLAHHDTSSAWRTAGFVLAFYVQFHAAILFGLRRCAIVVAHLGSLLITLGNGVFFATIYILLRREIPDWLGLFAVVAGASQWLLAWRVCPKDGVAERSNHALWHGGAGMLSLAAPIQFDRYLVSLAWALQSAVTFYFCRRSWRGWLRLKGGGVFAAALMHFILFDIRDAALTKQVAQFGFANFSWIIAIGVVIGIAAYIGAAALAVGRAEAKRDRPIAGTLITVGTILIMGVCAWQLDAYLATWTWLALGLGWRLVARRHTEVAAVCLLIGLAALVKFCVYDTITIATTTHMAGISGILFNRAVFTGVLVSVYLASSRNLASVGITQAMVPKYFLTLCALLCVTWTGTFETIRCLRYEPPGWLTDPMGVMGVAITLFWIANAAVLWWFSSRARPALTGYALVMTFVIAIKYVMFDALGEAMTGQWGKLSGLCTNRVFVTGIVLIGIALFACRRFKSLVDVGRTRILEPVHLSALFATTALLMTWTPTYELARAFRFEPIRSLFSNPTFAMHVAISVFWSISAMVLVIVGMRYHRAELRYIGIGLFGLTVAKVLRFDIWHIATIYRILSCLVLGVLLLFASLQYQRRAMRPDST